MKQLGLTPDEAHTVRALRAMGNPARFRILGVLADQDGCICGEMVDLLPLAQSTVSGHLKVLKEAGLIRGIIDGPATSYCVDWHALRELETRLKGLFRPAEERSTVMATESGGSGDAIREAVSARYAGKAQEGLMALEVLPASEDASCCGPGPCATGSCGTAYGSEDLAGLPASVTGVSLGCGNPVGLADVRRGETVLDLGSGGGIDCFLAARRVGPEGRVIGVDMTPEMVRLARGNAAQVGLPNVEFRLGEIEHLPVETGSVDLVISNCVVNLAPNKAAVYREVFRVLRARGRLVIADTVADRPVPDELRARLDSWSACASGSLDKEAYFATLRGAGFQRIEVLDEHPVEWGDLEGVRVSSMTLRALK